MGESSRGAERLVALFLLGAVAFSPLVLRVFDLGSGGTVLGVPSLFFYIFSAWALMIALLAFVTSQSDDLDVADGDETPAPPRR